MVTSSSDRSAGAGAEGCQPWSLPELEGLGPVRVGDIEAVHRDAHAQGFAEGRREGERRGYEEGLARAAAELDPRIAEFAAMLRSLADPLAEVDAEVEHSLVTVATAVATQLVAHELSVHPERVGDVVREALASLPLGSRAARVMLHPDDLELVREALEAQAQEGNLRLVEDASVGRGGCRVQTDVSFIDATVEARLATVITQVLGGERPAGRGDPR